MSWESEEGVGVRSNNNEVLFLLAFHQTHPLPNESTICIMFLPLMHLRLLLLLVAAIAFASPLASDAEYLGQGSIGPGPENLPGLDDGDVYHGSANGALTTSNYLDTSAVNLGSNLIAQSEDEIPKDQFQKFKRTRCGGEDSVCCMGDRTYFSSGVGTAWPCSMSIDTISFIHTFHSIFFVDTSPVFFFVIEQYVRGAGNENVGWFFDSRWTNYCHAPKYLSTCEELKVSFQTSLHAFLWEREDIYFLWLALTTISDSWIKLIMSVTLTAPEKNFFSLVGLRWSCCFEQDSADN